MSSKRYRNRDDNLPLPPVGKRRISGVIAILVAMVILASAGIGWWKSRQADAQPAAQSSVETKVVTSPATVAEPKPEFQKLAGKWVRPDGGYVIEVKSVDDGGKLDAAYFNPRPIHVAKAEASRADAMIKVFIELRDVNYPGSTYNLAYEPESDRLMGIYYQAALRQSYEVVFERVQ